MSTLQFRVSTGLKNIIGQQLITDDFVAVFELVKNSYDAHASKVEITFEDIRSGNGRIIIKDNGKGMNYDDLINRWLFVAYSAKRVGKEDENYDYRDLIHSKRAFAGAKGIGRFSCDKLGRYLTVETTKHEINSKTQILITDWEKFEENDEDNFIDIPVLYEERDKSDLLADHGTVLTIEGLRGEWDRVKYLKLKDALAKLISPTSSKDESNFEIILNVPEETKEDQEHTEYHEIVNGKVKNFIFETLGLKTTKIEAVISKDGKYIDTRLSDGGTLIYKIREPNTEFFLLDSIRFVLYYLNHSAKLTFASKMGMPSVQYGHVFLYRNGFRIYPYGEQGEDPLMIDRRKQQGTRRFLGTRDLIGLISILDSPILGEEGASAELRETSSRGDGLEKTPTFFELNDYFLVVLRRLEAYVVKVQKWGLNIEEDTSIDYQTRVSNLIAKLSGSKSIIDFETDSKIFDKIGSAQEKSARKIVTNLKRIADQSGRNEVIVQAEKVEKKLIEIEKAREEAERQYEQERLKALEATRKLKEKISENLFLKSISSSDYEEVISLLHHIGIYAGTIDSKLKGILLRVQDDISLTQDDLKEIVRSIAFEVRKILNVVAFSTKAKFNLKTEEMEVDLNEYCREYIQNIIPSITDKDLMIEVEIDTEKEFKRTLKPVELHIVIDNLINNAKKARATEIRVKFLENEGGNFEIRFIDNGRGMKEEYFTEIYKFGFTTTDGSGIGLYHVKKIMDDLGGQIRVKNNKDHRGVTFTIEFK